VYSPQEALEKLSAICSSHAALENRIGLVGIDCKLTKNSD
jgi:hypothetical protein